MSSLQITIFWINGRPCGTCAAGKESQVLESLNRCGESTFTPEKQTSSTEVKWQAYAKARASKECGGGGMSQEEAQKLLF